MGAFFRYMSIFRRRKEPDVAVYDYTYPAPERRRITSRDVAKVRQLEEALADAAGIDIEDAAGAVDTLTDAGWEFTAPLTKAERDAGLLRLYVNLGVPFPPADDNDTEEDPS